MFSPVRHVYSLRPQAPLSLVAGAVAVGSMFAATPFLIPELAVRYGISAGAAGYVSVIQVGAFGLVAFMAPRLIAPSPTLMTTAAVVLVASNALAAAPSTFWLLLTIRAFAGAAAGVITWMVWSDAMRQPRSMVTISVVGPITALIASPVLGAIAAAGDRAVYLTLAAVASPAIFLRLQGAAVPIAGRRVSRSRSNRVLLGALALLTASGASLFIYENVFAVTELGLTSLQASFAFSLNAAGGLAGARLASRHKRPGWFLASAGVAAVASVVLASPVVFYLALGWWGFAFWMGLPGVLQMLAARSLLPDERAGDAQALMALGRALGPAIGSAFVGGGRYTALAWVAGGGIALSGVTVISVQEGRERLPPTL